MSAIVLACILFGLGAVGGVTLLGLRLRGGNPPLGLALVHGLAAVAGFCALSYAIADGARGPAVIALVLLALAALGGIYVLSFHLRQVLIPVAVILVHGAVAASGYVALLVAVLR